MSGVKITNVATGEITVEGEVPTDTFEAHRASAVRHLGRDIELPGFRKGKAPAHILAGHIGEARILEEMANRALGEHLPKLFDEHTINAIGRPHITITKLAPKNPLGFKLTTAVLPEITLPDYATIAKEHRSIQQESVTVTDKEVEDAIRDIRRRVQMTEDQKLKTEDRGTETENLPELDDAFVKKLGRFDTVADFKKKLTEDITRFKEQQVREKRRVVLIEDIAKKTKAEIPALLIDAELDKMLARFRDDVARVGATWEEYLEQIKKTEADLRKEWRADAEKNATTQLVLNEIAKQENLAPDNKAVEREVAHLKSHHPDADPRGLEIYVRTLLTNEKVFEFLESQK